MCPVGQSGGHDDPRQFDEFVPGITAVFDTVLLELEGPIGQPVVAHELPGVLHRVEFRRSGRQGQERGVVGNVELFRGVQAGLIEHDNGVGAGCHLGGDFLHMPLHGLGVAARQHQGRAGAASRADGADYVGRIPLESTSESHLTQAGIT